MLILLILYTLSQFFVGKLVIRKLFGHVPQLLEIVSSLLFGVFISIPVTYVFSCIFSITGDPLLWGMIATAVLSSLLVVLRWKDTNIMPGTRNQQPATISDIVLILFSLTFSTWMMFKTFRGADGLLFVGSNNVFDFGLFIGIVRSMAWGGNIPLMSPFFTGFPLFYHFFFQFWVALWEYSGIPIVWAVNIPSIFSFSAFLILIYYVPQIILKKGKIVGWLAVILTLTHSTLTFWHIIFQKGISIQLIKDLWILPTYPFAGPFDGSTISIFTTLNSFVNQRHLSFGVAMGLFLYMVAVRNFVQKKITIRFSIFLGFLTGFLFLWNMAICLLVGVLIVFLFILRRSWKMLLFFLLGSTVLVFVSLSPYFPYFLPTFTTIIRMVSGAYGTTPQSLSSWTPGQFLWENFGILPILISIGYVVLSRNEKVVFFPFILFFIIECLFSGVGKRGFDQKFYSFLIIGANVVAAVGISWLWDKKSLMFRGLAIMFLFALSVSGVVDLMAIKNEFAYPFISKDIVPVISWIQQKTPKNAVFVSYADMIDPIVLSGRKNYFGFFGNVGWTDRSPIVKDIYAGDVRTAQKFGISYILIPKWEKSDFSYTVDTMYFQEHRMVVYEDEKFMIVRTESEK